MRGFQIIDVPMPTRLGPGLYQPWLDRCRAEVNVNPMVNDLTKIRHSVLAVIVPAGSKVDLLILLPCADRLMRDMGAVAGEFVFGEYGTALSAGSSSTADGRALGMPFWLWTWPMERQASQG